METTQIEGLNDNDQFIKFTFNKHLFPSILSVFGVTVSTMSNNLIAGSLLGADALAVMSIVSPLYFVYATLGSLIGVGGSALAAKEIGKDNVQGANQAFTLSAALLLGTGMFLTVLWLINLSPLLRLMGASDTLLEMSYAYSRIYILGGTATAAIYLPFNFLKLEGKLHLSVGIFFMMAVLNIGLDLCFVSFLNMGIAGIALGTALATVLTAVVGWGYLLSGNCSFRLVSLKGQVRKLGKIAVLGSPAALNNLSTVIRTILLNQIIASAAGSAGLSAFSIVSTVNNLALTVISGISQATAPFAGVFSAERDNISIRQLERQAVLKGELLTLFFGLAVGIFAVPFCDLFGIRESDRLAEAIPAIRIFLLSLPLSMAANVLLSYYLASGRTWIANLMTFCRAFLFITVISSLFLETLGVHAVWWSFTGADLLTFLLLALLIFLQKRKHPSCSGFLLLDRRIEQDGRYISFTVRSSVPSIMEGSERMAEFCEQNQLDKKRSMLISLALEEMLISVKEHIFPNIEEQPMNIRIFILPDFSLSGNDSIILRIRCSGSPFNPIAYYENKQAEVAEEFDDSLGIQMIVNAARTVDYKNTFGVNNLTIII